MYLLNSGSWIGGQKRVATLLKTLKFADKMKQKKAIFLLSHCAEEK